MDMKNKNFQRSVSKVVRIMVCLCNFKVLLHMEKNMEGK